MRLELVSLYGDLRYVSRLPGLRRYGVPTGGPFDAESAALASVLVSADPDLTIELGFGQATFVVREGGTLAVVGAGRHERLSLLSGAELVLVPEGGARLSLAVPGGWSRPPLGPDPEVSLRITPGDSMATAVSVPMDPVVLGSAPRSLENGILRVVAGPQRELWAGSPPSLIVAPWLDRRGVRLAGGPPHGHEIASEPCLPGVVQWTPAGDLIALGPDGPTIGGYPKPFVVIAADLDRLGQLLPGRAVQLVEISIDEAWQDNADGKEDLRRRLARLRIGQTGL